MPSLTQLAGLVAVLTSVIVQPTYAKSLGINCRGSGLCPLASWESKGSESVSQGLRDAVWQSPKPNETIYHNGDHIICVSSSQPISLNPSGSIGFAAPEGPSAERSTSFTLSGKINTGGVCLFLQYMPDDPGLSLGKIRELTDAILEHGCKACGSVPVHFVDEGWNDPGWGILTFNVVKDPYCTDQCIGADGAASDPHQLPKSAKFRL